METRKPKKGDRVRVTFEAEFTSPMGGQHDLGMCWDGNANYWIPKDATIEILKPEPKEGDWGVTEGGHYVRFQRGQWRHPSGLSAIYQDTVEPLDG